MHHRIIINYTSMMCTGLLLSRCPNIRGGARPQSGGWCWHSRMGLRVSLFWNFWHRNVPYAHFGGYKCRKTDIKKRQYSKQCFKVSKATKKQKTVTVLFGEKWSWVKEAEEGKKQNNIITFEMGVFSTASTLLSYGPVALGLRQIIWANDSKS